MVRRWVDALSADRPAMTGRGAGRQAIAVHVEVESTCATLFVAITRVSGGVAQEKGSETVATDRKPAIAARAVVLESVAVVKAAPEFVRRRIDRLVAVTKVRGTAAVAADTVNGVRELAAKARGWPKEAVK